MNMFKIGIANKMIALLLGFALIPLAVFSFTVLSSLDGIKDQASERFKVAAETIADKIDRNMFERYGDVQAFTLNDIIQNSSNWYMIPGQDEMMEAAIVEAMNEYVQTYGIYLLTVLVDLEGKVVAVNSVDAKGAPIDSASLYNSNMSGTDWFRALSTGKFTTSMPFSAPGNDTSTGTYVEDLLVDEDVKNSYSGSDGLTLGFSAPVHDHNGNVIAYWSNRTDFSLVEEIFRAEYQLLKQGGFSGAELTLLDKGGRVLVDYDPAVRKTENIVRDMVNVIMQLNLVKEGVSIAENAVQGQAGSEYALHARKNIVQAGGYSHLKGALGFPGMNWSVLVRVPESEASPWLARIESNIITILLLCIALVSGVGLFVGRSVVRTIVGIVEVTEKAAEGDLGVRLEVDSKDEFGQLASAFNAMLERLGTVVMEVREGSGSILVASNEIVRGNMDLSQRSEEQATSLEETASSMEEMTTTVKQNSDSADEANKLAVSAREQAEKGGEVVKDTEVAMSAINASSKKIADIIGVIDDIAFQTNLLALNAAVEAARAGDQGRGFAVVAGEVRILAQRSADAAKEIKGLIVDSVAKVEQGSELVNRSGETLTEIVSSIKSAADLVAEIAAASRQQASGIDQVNGAVMQMNDMTQENSALVEEASAASKSMEDQANKLIDMIEFFKIDKESSRQVTSPVPASVTASQMGQSTPVVTSSSNSSSLRSGQEMGSRKKEARVAESSTKKEATISHDGSEWNEF